MEERPPIWRAAVNILNKQLWTADKGWSSRLGVGRGIELLPVKTYFVMKYSQTKPRTWTGTLIQPKQRKRDMRFGTWNVRSLYRAGSFTAPARELARHKLDLVGVQKGTVRAEDYNFFLWKRK